MFQPRRAVQKTWYFELVLGTIFSEKADLKNTFPKKSQVLDQVYNHWNHPHLTTVILGAQYLLRYIQGRNGVYFCGSLATPGNGHDLSFCSGMAVACAIGAKYPFEKENKKCVDDFVLLKSLMGL